MTHVTREGILFCLAGPAGSGKTTIGERLVLDNRGTLVRSISVTSRAPRPNEIDGREYHFVSEDRFVQLIEEGELFEWEKIHDNYYGTLRKSLHDAIHAGVDMLLIIDIKGAVTIKKSFGKNAVTIFVIPPHFEHLEKRMMHRGAIESDELARRLGTAKDEYRYVLDEYERQAHSVDYLIVNEVLEMSYEKVRGVLIAERERLSRLEKQYVQGVLRCTLK
jgi:guanylate kinase